MNVKAVLLVCCLMVSSCCAYGVWGQMDPSPNAGRGVDCEDIACILKRSAQASPGGGGGSGGRDVQLSDLMRLLRFQGNGDYRRIGSFNAPVVGKRTPSSSSTSCHA